MQERQQMAQKLTLLSFCLKEIILMGNVPKFSKVSKPELRVITFPWFRKQVFSVYFNHRGFFSCRRCPTFASHGNFKPGKEVVSIAKYVTSLLLQPRQLKPWWWGVINCLFLISHQYEVVHALGKVKSSGLKPLTSCWCQPLVLYSPL